MTDRKTASTITDTELDQLYAELAALRAVARGYCPHCGRGDAAPTVEDWEQERQSAGFWFDQHKRARQSAADQRQRAKRAEAAITRVRDLHREEYGLCDECTGSHGVPWPCPTIQALDQPAPATAATRATDASNP
ncbi:MULTISPECIES: hypothetical protein [unclassified Streptomyces]|uniref:hypothetical protein n=1 Tax=unclassified Streptomyces TaxID=2593676 RepID=UPI0004C4CF10|nr:MULTISPECIES: hypothetical protein [unclassified Streptomyces]KOV86086.1 hypothetical protein ADL02_19540 [Streptomyces sp. NRRL WC-3723]